MPTQTFECYTKGSEISTIATLVIKECGECHILFAMPADKEKRCKQSGEGWYCPNGHSRAYIETENQKLKQELAAAQENERLERQWKERERAQRIEIEKKASAALSAATERRGEMSDKKTILRIADGPESIELYTSEDEGVVDWVGDLPALYLTASVSGAFVRLGPFHLKSIRERLVPALTDGAER